MSNRGWGRRNRWWPLFILALGTLGGALGFLVMAAMDGNESDAPSDRGLAPSATPPAASRNRLTYEGPLPAPLVGAADLRPVKPGESADIRFEPSTGGAGVAPPNIAPGAARWVGVD